MSMLAKFRQIRAGLADALVVEDGEVDEDGNFILYSDDGSVSGSDDGVEGGERSTAVAGAGASSASAAALEAQLKVLNERYDRVQREFSDFREQSASQMTDLRAENQRLAQLLKLQQQLRQPQSVPPVDGGLTEGSDGQAEAGPTADTDHAADGELSVLREAKTALQTALATERRRYAALCEQFDASQAGKLELQLKWERMSEGAAHHVERLRQKYGRSENNDENRDEREVAVSAQATTKSHSGQGAHEDVLYLKQAVNDAIVKTCAGMESPDDAAEENDQDQTSDSETTRARKVAPGPLDLRSNSAQAFVHALQQLVQYIQVQLQRRGSDDPTLKLQLDQLQKRLAASNEARAAAQAAVDEVSSSMAARLLKAEEGAETLRQQRAAGEARQDQLMAQVTALCREKDEALDTKRQLHAELANAQKTLQEHEGAAAVQKQEVTRLENEVSKLKSELEQKNVTWDEYALFQARLEEAEDLCKQQAEKLAVHLQERDEAVATVERLRQQQSVMRDRVAALSSDLAIKDEDARQATTQLENLNAAMQRLEIEAQAQRETLKKQLQDQVRHIQTLEKEHAASVEAAKASCREEAKSELRLKDLKLQQQESELQAARFAQEAALRKLQEAAPEASVDRRLVATMLGSFFRARGSAKKQAEIIALVAKVLGDDELAVLGAPQSLAGKAGSLLGSLWGGGGGRANRAGEEASTVGDLWMEFLMKEAGAQAQAQEVDQSGREASQDSADTAPTAAGAQSGDSQNTVHKGIPSDPSP
eukprot:INCI10822.1.p1 GENE.INCI10822.1~~INCI10822.1.p1  ORF type:complete len:767 (-),score=225.94 INCI10822.1:1066-3366(-)